jgi:hypothetical protein
MQRHIAKTRRSVRNSALQTECCTQIEKEPSCSEQSYLTAFFSNIIQDTCQVSLSGSSSDVCAGVLELELRLARWLSWLS